MSQQTKLGLGILAAALALGILGDALLQVSPWGLNVVLWMMALAGAVAILVRWQRIDLPGGGRWLILPALLFAAALAWRDSLTLGIVNALAVLVGLTLATTRSRTGRVRIAGIMDYALDAVLSGVFAIVGVMMLVFGDIRWREIPRSGSMGHAMAVVRGLAIGVPLIVVFGGLFVAADAVFEGMVASLFRWDFADLVGRIILVAIIAWLVGGSLQLMLLDRERVDLASPSLSSRPLGIVEAGIVLGLLNALFLAFVLVQFRYFFGGAAMVGTSTDLTYAEYARRGFFELVTVAALMLPLLLLADWVVRKDSPVHMRIFRLLVAGLVVMLFVVMASALQRMRLYQTEFGLTELRLYTTVFMGWTGIVFVWFLATVLVGRRDRFAFGMLVTGFLAVAFLNLVNPDALVVQTNVNRAKAEQPLDAPYVASLSADAVPALVNLIPDLPEKERRSVATAILDRWSAAPGADWRTWNWGRFQAWLAVNANEETLNTLARTPG